MFVGHFGVAFMAKRLAPRASLGALIVGAELVDFVFPLLVLLGAEHVRIAPGVTRVVPLDFYDYPISHSLLGVGAWALLAGLVYFRVTRYARGALVIGGLVMSHWVLDVVSHRPDVPLLPRGPLLGLGLWNNLALSIAVEGGIFAVGLYLYVRDTYAHDGVGRYALFALGALLAVNQGASYLGPPPPSVRAVVVVSLCVALFAPLASWADRHREFAPRAPGQRG